MTSQIGKQSVNAEGKGDACIGEPFPFSGDRNVLKARGAV